MLNLHGNLCEMGELDPEFLPRDGFRIERPDGSVVTVTGLTREEVRGLSLFVDVTLNVSAAIPPEGGERKGEKRG